MSGAEELHDEIRQIYADVYKALDIKQNEQISYTTISEQLVKSNFDEISTIFYLTEFERKILLLCLCVELDSNLAKHCARFNNQQQLAPTFYMVLTLFTDNHWDALSPQRPLRFWRLIEFDAEQSVLHTALRVNERILHYIFGDNSIDSALFPFIIPTSNLLIAESLENRDTINIAKLIHYAIENQTDLPIINLIGDDPRYQYAVAQTVCKQANLQLLTINIAALPTDVIQLDKICCLLEREAILSNSVYYFINESSSAIQFILERLNVICFLTNKKLLNSHFRTTHTFELNKQLVVDKTSLWQDLLGEKFVLAESSLPKLMNRFCLSTQQLYEISQEFIAVVDETKPASVEPLLWQLFREKASKHLDSLVDIVKPRASWQQLILPQQQLDALREIVDSVNVATTVQKQWGFGNGAKRGMGLSVLFTGPSGTGKTLAAEVIANELALDLYHVDLSALVSKYVGETEKNIKKVFDTAQGSGAVLLFDEADALFSKRHEVKDSNDRYANLEISYLLQKMEGYSGLAILTSNLKSSLDTAFMRRLRYIVHFPFPSMQQRESIWRNVFPKQTPLENVDYKKLAALNISGGNIFSIAIKAAFAAASQKQAVDMKHIHEAAKSEYTKLEKSLTELQI